MEIQLQYRYTFGIRLAVIVRKRELAHAYLYFMTNDQHNQPFGLLEDLWVIESQRQLGYGKMLIKKVMAEAERHGCYKLIATSRYACLKAHKFYRDLGFRSYGKEFRIDL